MRRAKIAITGMLVLVTGLSVVAQSQDPVYPLRRGLLSKVQPALGGLGARPPDGGETWPHRLSTPVHLVRHRGGAG